MDASKRKAVLFDLDGVLIDSYQQQFEATRLSCARRGLHLDELTFAELFESNFAVFAQTIAGFRLPPEDIEDWRIEKDAIFRELILDDFPAMNGVEEMLRALREGGYALAVIAPGAAENLRCILRLLPGAPLFDAVVSGDELGPVRHGPELYRKAADQVGLPPACCIAVEDSLSGLRAAQTMGMRGVGITGTSSLLELKLEAALVLTNLSDLTPAVCDRLLTGVGV